MNFTTLHFSDISGETSLITLPKQAPNWAKIALYGSSLSFFGILLLFLVDYLGPKILYGDIISVTLLTIIVCGIILFVYRLVNEMYYRSMLILTPQKIFLGKKFLFRPSTLVDSRINPTSDLQLVIIMDSRSHQFRLFLEGKFLVQLATYNTLAKVETQRQHFQKLLAKFYPKIFISLPKFLKIAKN